MRNPSQHILFLATEYDAPGMHPYAINIINSMWQAGDHVMVVTRHGPEDGVFPGIPDDCVTWIDYPTSKLQRALFRYFPKRLNRAIDRVLESCEISLIYSLTGELVLAPSIRRLQTRQTVLYTVHDAVYHDYKFRSPVEWLKDRLIIALPQQRLFKYTVNKVTNSLEQRDDILSRFPYHKVYYAPFPTLVNDAIVLGGTPVPELTSVQDGYILFFGTLHLYKGVHLLYEAHQTHPELRDVPLVIAGTQDIYFERCADENNVTFINRFISDSEVKDLFSRAAVVVYPYISATQSGVVSIASYFGKPMVVSDLPFFRQTCEGFEGIETFPPNDSESLASAIVRSLKSSASTRPLYDSQYAPEALHSALTEIVSGF